MVTPRTGRPRGAPKKSFLVDPERFAVAFVDALLVLGVSQTDAFKVAAARLVGKPVASQLVGPRRKRGRGAIAGGTNISYEPKAAIEGRAVTLRRKYKKSMTADVGKWRLAMGRAFLLALTGKDKTSCAAEILQTAAAVGEAKFAELVLLPLLAARANNENSCLPDLLTDVRAEKT